jgi:carbon-monoxide dehydrogenase medium subunit
LKPPPFDYVSAGSLDEALDALAEGGEDAKVLAGGQSLIPLMSLRLAHPSVLVDVNRVPELAGVAVANGSLTIGAMTRHRAIERSAEAASAVPLLAQVMPLIGHVAIRSRGTIGGSIAHADPAAELPAVAVALGATFTVRSRDRGERTIAAEDFFDGYFTTALEPDEILVSVELPRTPPNTGSCVEEVARRHGDFALVGAVATVTADNGTIRGARIAMINVADRPVRPIDAEEALAGVPLEDAAIEEAAALAVRDLDPSGDLHASPAYRRKVAAVCVRRALRTAANRALEAVR